MGREKKSISATYFIFIKVHIFWEGHKILRNLHRRFDQYYIGQIYSGDFAKFGGLLRIYELYCWGCGVVISKKIVAYFPKSGHVKRKYWNILKPISMRNMCDYFLLWWSVEFEFELTWICLHFSFLIKCY